MAEADGLQDRDTQKYYESLIDLFVQPGWKYFAEDLAKLHAAADTLTGIETMEQLHFRRGQVDILKKIIAQPFVTEAAYEQLKNAEPS